MIILLHNDVGGLFALEQSLTAPNTKQWLGELRPIPKVILTLPKFKMTRQFELQDTLGAMGMTRAFDAHADFSGISFPFQLRFIRPTSMSTRRELKPQRQRL